MIKKMVLTGVAVASLFALADPAFAVNRTVPIGDISLGDAATGSVEHFRRGTGAPLPNGVRTETYASSAKAFVDQILFRVTGAPEGTPVGGNGVFRIQFLEGANGQVQKNVTNGRLSLFYDPAGANEAIINDVALTSGAPFIVPFLAGSYRALVSGNASGVNGGDYQITFSTVAPVPEPAVVGSMGAGLLLAGFVATRRRRKAAKVA